MPPMKVGGGGGGVVGGESEAEGSVSGGDGEGEAEAEGEGDTERSGGSSRPDRDSSAEEADEPDSDDSSEMDEGECERRRNDCLDNLADLERQFTVLREQLYRERVNQVDYQLAEVRGGRSQEYLGPLQQLQENMRVRIEVAGVLRQMRIENIKHKYEAEEQAALQNFESEKWLAWEWLHEELLEKIRRLEEDRHAVDCELDELGPGGGGGGGGGRAARARSRRKVVTVSGPFIVYMLDDRDIREDWTLIRKALKRSSP